MRTMKNFDVTYMKREDGDLQQFTLQYACYSLKDAKEIAKLTATARGWRVFSVYSTVIDADKPDPA